MNLRSSYSQCRAAGCTNNGKAFMLCNAHSTRLRRHGHVQQRAVTEAMLKRWRKVVRAWLSEDAGDAVYAACCQQWSFLIEEATKCIRLNRERGGVAPFVVKAAECTLAVSRDVETRLVIETLLTMGAAWEGEPSLFRDDKAFRCQLVRRFRALTDRHCGEYWDYVAQRKKRVYREIPPRAIEALAHALMPGFIDAGRSIAKLNRERQLAMVEGVSSIHDAVRDMERAYIKGMTEAQKEQRATQERFEASIRERVEAADRVTAEFHKAQSETLVVNA